MKQATADCKTQTLWEQSASQCTLPLRSSSPFNSAEASTSRTIDRIQSDLISTWHDISMNWPFHHGPHTGTSFVDGRSVKQAGGTMVLIHLKQFYEADGMKSVQVYTSHFTPLRNILWVNVELKTAFEGHKYFGSLSLITQHENPVRTSPDRSLCQRSFKVCFPYGFLLLAQHPFCDF